MITDDLLAAAQGVLPDVVELRRDLHVHPELGNHLPRTQGRVLEALDGLRDRRRGDADPLGGPAKRAFLGGVDEGEDPVEEVSHRRTLPARAEVIIDS